MVNDYLGRPLPAETVKLASGFPVGMGAAGCACGALSGGIMALGLKFGRTKPRAEMPDMFRVSKELHDELSSWLIKAGLLNRPRIRGCTAYMKKEKATGIIADNNSDGVERFIAEREVVGKEFINEY